MARKLVLALLCAAVAVVAARELSQAAISVAELPKQLQELNSRWVALHYSTPTAPPPYGPYCYRVALDEALAYKF